MALDIDYQYSAVAMEKAKISKLTSLIINYKKSRHIQRIDGPKSNISEIISTLIELGKEAKL